MERSAAKNAYPLKCRTALSGILALVGAVFAVCLLASGIPAERAHAGELKAETRLMAQATEYSVWVGGVNVTSSNKGNVLGDKKKSVVYNPKTNTLTLKNAKIKGGLFWYLPDNGTPFNDGIVSATGKALRVKLVGTSTITVPYKSGASISNGIVSFDGSASDFADVIVYGTGKLTVKAAKAQYYSDGISAAKLTVKDKAKLVVSGASASSKADEQYGGYGVNVTQKILITGNARVEASGSKAAYYGYEGRVTPTFKKYIPRVKAGTSAKSIKLNKKSPDASVYTEYKYVSITKAK